MLPEGVGKRRAFVKTGPASPLTNELLENAKLAVEKLWKQRSYDPKKPEAIKAKLGYACDQYEASAYLVTGALHKPLISHEEAKYIGKRITNIIGKSGSVGKQLVPLKKRGAASAPQIRALLLQPAALNFEPPPRAAPAPAPAPAPQPLPPAPAPSPPVQPPPLPPPTMPVFVERERVVYEHPIPKRVGRDLVYGDDAAPGYRAIPANGFGIEGEDTRCWDPRAAPCVPSDYRPARTFRSFAAANATAKAARVEMFMQPPDYDPESLDHYDQENDEVSRVQYKWAMSKLQDQGLCPDPCPMFAHASQHQTRPCPCGRGALGKWPWVIHSAELGFCDCEMALWELTCWRHEWADGLVAY